MITGTCYNRENNFTHMEVKKTPGGMCKKLWISK